MVTLKHIAAGFIASCFVIAITADSADARRGGGGGGGVRAGGGGGGAAMRAGGARGGIANAGARRAYVSNPIARPGIGNRPAGATTDRAGAAGAGLIDRATVGARLPRPELDWRMPAPMATATTVMAMRRTAMGPRSRIARAGSALTTHRARRILPTMAAAFLARNRTQRAVNGGASGLVKDRTRRKETQRVRRDSPRYGPFAR